MKQTLRMRLVLGTWVGSLGFVLACDGGVTLDGAAAPHPGTEKPIPAIPVDGSESPEPVPASPPTEPTQPAEPTPPPEPTPALDLPTPFDASFDNSRCANAVPIGEGLLGVPVNGGGAGVSCFGGPWPTRYFSVTANPRELVTIHLDAPSGQGVDLVWLAAQPDCTTVAEVVSDHCSAGWANRHSGLVIENDSDGTRTYIVGARRLGRGDTSGHFDMTVTRTTRAAHARCDSALPVVRDTFVVDPSGAGVRQDWTYKRELYYAFELPPLSRATVKPTSPTHHYLFLMDGCASPTLAHELYNPTEQPMTALVFATDIHGMEDPPFEARLTFEPVVESGFCERAETLAAGADIEIEPAMGGPTPDNCWCITTARVIYVEAEIPPKSRVRIEAESADETGMVVLVDQPGHCADGCGFDPVFGFDGAATMNVDNDGDLPTTIHLVVESRAGWASNSTPEPPNVTLRSRVIGSL